MVKILRCKHCNHEWATRREILPKICPKCKSKRWNQKPLLKYLPKSKLQPKFKVKDELNQGSTALALMEQRYLLKDEKGNITETPKQMFQRVAKHVAKADLIYNENAKETEEEFYSLLSNLEFLPGSPTLFNAGTPLGQLASCFVLDIQDSLESIFTTLKNSALIMQSGGGVGFNFSKLRPKGDVVKSTAGVASGPTSFARIYDIATEVVKSGGKRRGAMMGILNYNHPDIKEFITAKSKENILTNFNLSIGIMDEFMKNIEEDKDYWLINPRNNKEVEKVNAKKIFNLIIENAWKHGDPGLIFLDEVNKKNPTPQLGELEACNPCAEFFAYPGESCNLGSINLSKFVKNGKIEWDKLVKIIKSAVHFLDNVIEVNLYPLKEIEQITKANRKIGLGLMSWADFLISLKIPYNSEEALKLAGYIMEFINFKAKEASVELAKKRGRFLNFRGSIYEK